MRVIATSAAGAQLCITDCSLAFTEHLNLHATTGLPIGTLFAQHGLAFNADRRAPASPAY